MTTSTSEAFSNTEQPEGSHVTRVTIEFYDWPDADQASMLGDAADYLNFYYMNREHKAWGKSIKVESDV